MRILQQLMSFFRMGGFEDEQLSRVSLYGLFEKSMTGGKNNLVANDFYISIVDVMDVEELNTVVKIFKIGYLSGNKHVA